jgi:RNA polymerase sigma factor (sigma-70 family)
MTPPSLRTRILVGPALRAQPDRRLVTLAREGHEPALEEVVRRYRPALVRYAATIVSADRADDVVQDSIARALPAIRGDADLNLRPWLYTIVRNTALNNIRDAGPSMDHLDENYDGVEQPPQALERREDLAAVVTGVQALPESQRKALVKREMEGMSHAEIGASMGVSIAAARQLIHRGRLSLREGLGALIPMPVLRQLLEGMSGPAAAGTGAGGALAAKAIVALLAAGGALTAGVALDRHSNDQVKADSIVAERAAPESGGGGSHTIALGSSGASSGDRRAGHEDSQGSRTGPDSGSKLTSLDSTGTAAGGRHDGPGPGDDGPSHGSGQEGDSHASDEGGGEHHGVSGGEDHSGSGEGSGSGHESGGGSGSGEPSNGGGDGSGSGDGDQGSSGGSGGDTADASEKGSSGDGGSSGSGSGEPQLPHPEGD